jgi:hypothetical protein
MEPCLRGYGLTERPTSATSSSTSGHGERGQLVPGTLANMIATAGIDGLKPAQILFCALMLELWQRVWVDGSGAVAGRQPGRVGAIVTHVVTDSASATGARSQRPADKPGIRWAR